MENSTGKLRRLGLKLMASHEEEKQRLANELHESVGQVLAAVKYWVEVVLSHAEEGDRNSAFTRLEQLVPILQLSIEETRNISMDLRPSMLDSMGLLATLEWLRGHYGRMLPGRHVELDIKAAEGEIPESLKIHLFRIIQEALRIFAGYVDTDRLRVSLEKIRNEIELAIFIGMKKKLQVLEACTSTIGFGMRERAELTGGRFTMESAPEEGTTIRVAWTI